MLKYVTKKCLIKTPTEIVQSYNKDLDNFFRTNQDNLFNYKKDDIIPYIY